MTNRYKIDTKQRLVCKKICLYRIFRFGLETKNTKYSCIN